ncbi:MazG nucleotide pyrophosphohydrolase domain-containing protein [Cellulomonas sp. HZM]|uniref:MazG nucleotide pyrophosphohydrolase domain-containing protein n=1 Tax=Cellulomonas sp. HZM TaxID=1454010 RepID=UPI0009DF9D7A|nr:MazG nucleotide pyrophosphohydrolase domain-containing protein [Cellulomonas sp. HZM]
MQIAAAQREIEVISRVYGRLFGVDRTDDWLVLKLHEEVGELTQAFLTRSGRTRDRGLSAQEADDAVRAELADVLAHVLLIAERMGVDLDAALEDKWFRYRHLVTDADRAGAAADDERERDA